MNARTILLIAAISSLGFQVTYAEDGHDHAEKPATGAKVVDDHAEDAHDEHDDHHGHGESGGGHADEVKLTPAAIRDNGIRIAKATMQPLVASLVAPARVSFNLDAMAHVGSVVKGRVVELKARVGDVVKQGDEMLVVESPELGQSQSEYLRQRQAVVVAELNVEPTKQAYERAKGLFNESQGIALGEVQKREAEYRSATANVLTAKAELSAAENTLHLLGITQGDVAKLAETSEINPRFVIHAPISGQVVEREVTLGELVSPEKEKLLVLADTSNYWVLADVPEARLSEVGVGSRARIEVTALRNDSFEGTVSLVSSTVDAQTRSARLRIEVTNGHTSLKPGMFARATVWTNAVAGAEPVLVIPDEAVQTVEGSTSVFVPVTGEENTFKRVAVKVGKSVGGMLPVYEGLKSGDELVISGSFILKAELGKSEASHEH